MSTLPDVTQDPPVAYTEEDRPTGLVLTCEHAANALPRGFDLGAPPELLASHRGYDVGALGLSRRLHARFGGWLVASSYSRLFVDLNRGESEPDCVPEAMDGVPLPGNAIDADARAQRLAAYHRPYHAAVDRTLRRSLEQQPRTFLLSVHTYTARLGEEVRALEAGVLFDEYEPLARCFLEGLAGAGFTAEPNAPYCGYRGLIYSANRHGRAHGVPYLELEVRNDLLAPPLIDHTARRVAAALAPLLRDVLAQEPR